MDDSKKRVRQQTAPTNRRREYADELFLNDEDRLRAGIGGPGPGVPEGRSSAGALSQEPGEAIDRKGLTGQGSGGAKNEPVIEFMEVDLTFSDGPERRPLEERLAELESGDVRKESTRKAPSPKSDEEEEGWPGFDIPWEANPSAESVPATAADQTDVCLEEFEKALRELEGYVEDVPGGSFAEEKLLDRNPPAADGSTLSRRDVVAVDEFAAAPLRFPDAPLSDRAESLRRTSPPQTASSGHEEPSAPAPSSRSFSLGLKIAVSLGILLFLGAIAAFGFTLQRKVDLLEKTLSHLQDRLQASGVDGDTSAGTFKTRLEALEKGLVPKAPPSGEDAQKGLSEQTGETGDPLKFYRESREAAP